MRRVVVALLVAVVAGAVPLAVSAQGWTEPTYGGNQGACDQEAGMALDEGPIDLLSVPATNDDTVTLSYTIWSDGLGIGGNFEGLSFEVSGPGQAGLGVLAFVGNPGPGMLLAGDLPSWQTGQAQGSETVTVDAADPAGPAVQDGWASEDVYVTSMDTAYPDSFVVCAVDDGPVSAASSGGGGGGGTATVDAATGAELQTGETALLFGLLVVIALLSALVVRGVVTDG